MIAYTSFEKVFKPDVTHFYNIKLDFYKSVGNSVGIFSKTISKQTHFPKTRLSESMMCISICHNTDDNLHPDLSNQINLRLFYPEKYLASTNGLNCMDGKIFDA